MYATCLFCHAALGTNESIEHFPIGRRLAFDSATGRLWVVCRKCERWNLSPLEERWEAIEQAERAYRSTRKRAATENIGLARLNDGTDLIRIGAPLRPEFAAWRYGDQFGRRRRNRLLFTGATAVAGYGFIVGAQALAIGAIVGPLISPAITIARSMIPSVRVPNLSGGVFKLTRSQLKTVQISATRKGEIRVQFPHMKARTGVSLYSPSSLTARLLGPILATEVMSGAPAERALSILLPALNRYGGSAKQITAAVELSAGAAKPAALLKTVPAVARSAFMLELGFTNLPPLSVRLALEMMLHEDSERRALEGELHELERRWKEADEIAAIADALTLPDATTNRVDEMRRSKK